MLPAPRTHESGSLVLGLALLVSVTALGALFLLSALHETARFEQAAQRRSRVLAEKSLQTQALNRLATNNALILVLLANALEGYAEATLAATAFQSSIPFWLSKPMDPILTEQEPVENYFTAASRNFARQWSRAFALSQDSDHMLTSLAQAHPRWLSALQPITSRATLCLAMKILAAKKTSPRIASTQVTSTLRVRYEFQQNDRCAMVIKGLTGQWRVFDVSQILHLAQIPKNLDVAIVAMGPGAPLEQAVPPASITWKHSPLTLMRGTTHTLQLPPARVHLVHPRLQQAKMPPYATLLEPNWVPIYVTSQLGG